MTDVKLIPAVCPRCGANLKFPDDLKRAHCMYCGTQIIVAEVGRKDRVECRLCKGSGRLSLCHACRGTGACSWSITANMRSGLSSTMVTAHCHSGSCSACGGSGNIFLTPCPACGGSGRCPECRGSGKCNVCHGLTMLPNPAGQIVCKTCGGDGFVDSGDIEIPSSDKCPTCGASWAPDGVYCPKCGQPKNCPRCGVAWKARARFCAHCGYRKGSRT